MIGVLKLWIINTLDGHETWSLYQYAWKRESLYKYEFFAPGHKKPLSLKFYSKCIVSYRWELNNTLIRKAVILGQISVSILSHTRLRKNKEKPVLSKSKPFHAMFRYAPDTPRPLSNLKCSLKSNFGVIDTNNYA